MTQRFACGSKELELPLSRFPLRGKAGAGGFPPRRARAAPANPAGTPSAAALPTRGCAPLVHPPLGYRFSAALSGFASRPFNSAFRPGYNFVLAETIAAG